MSAIPATRNAKQRGQTVPRNDAAASPSPWARHGAGEPPGFALIQEHLNSCVVAAALLLAILVHGQRLSGHYVVLAIVAYAVALKIVTRPRLDHSGGAVDWGRMLRHITVEWVFLTALLLLAGHLLEVSRYFSRAVVLTWFAITPAFLVAAHAAARTYADWLRVHGGVHRRQVIAGANRVGRDLATRLLDAPWLGSFDGYFDDRRPERLPHPARSRLLGRFADIPDYARRHPELAIYFCLPISRQPRIRALLDLLGDTTASIYFVPDVTSFDLMQARFGEIGGMPLVAIRESPFCGMAGVLKRASDLALAAIALLLAAPAMAAIAIQVRRSSPGPILFRQRRYGLDGREFVAYKFRTMTTCEDEPVRQAQRDDPRVTPVGRFLRRTSLDELPQLFNVLGGSMSLVGPRPHAVAHNEQYRRLVSGYMLRHKVRPGITGLAQVNGLRGETPDLETMRQRVRFDLEYLKHWSLGLDVRILLKTARIFLTDKNAF